MNNNENIRPTRLRPCGRALRSARESFIRSAAVPGGDASANYRMACHPLGNAAQMP
jgi:hypothetical protein